MTVPMAAGRRDAAGPPTAVRSLGHHGDVSESDPTAPGPAAPEPTPPTGARGPMTMVEYEEAMSPRGVHARARGLAAPYIAGGRDPDPEAGRRQERHYMRLLVLMVAVIVLGGFVISIVGLIVTGGG